MSDLLPEFASLHFGEGGEHKDFNRFNWRWKLLFERNVHALRDKIVLDLACNTGRMAFPCIKLGATKVMGVEARPELIERGKRIFDEQGVADRMEWHKSDLFTYLEGMEPRSVDTILCLGFLYHTTRQIDFFREIRRLRPSYVIIDTSVAHNYRWIGRSNLFKKPPALFLVQEDANKTSDTTDVDGLAYWPSRSYLETMFDKAGYQFTEIDFRKAGIKDWAGMSDYRKGSRAAYIAKHK